MTQNWKPGDVALRADEVVVFTDDGWVWAETGLVCLDQSDNRTRPLVVIDPEDVEQVERMLRAFDAALVAHWSEEKPATEQEIAETIPVAQTGLRSLLEPPAPPKPDEPLGYGAVVEDAKGRRWIRTAGTDCADTWQKWDSYDSAQYGSIEVVKVLSEGVKS